MKMKVNIQIDSKLNYLLEPETKKLLYEVIDDFIAL